MTWKVVTVPEEEIRNIWGTVAPMLARAIPYSGGRMTMRALFERCTSRQSLLWIAYDDVEKVPRAAFVTRVAAYPGRSVLVIDCAGGRDMAKWLRVASDTFRRFARAANLRGVELYGRPGWCRILAALGWRSAFTVVEVDWE